MYIYIYIVFIYRCLFIYIYITIYIIWFILSIPVCFSKANQQSAESLSSSPEGYPSSWWCWQVGGSSWGLEPTCWTYGLYNSLEDLAFRLSVPALHVWLYRFLRLVTIFLRSVGWKTLVNNWCHGAMCFSFAQPTEFRTLSQLPPWRLQILQLVRCDGIVLACAPFLVPRQQVYRDSLQTSTLTTFIYSSTIPRLHPTNFLKRRYQAQRL